MLFGQYSAGSFLISENIEVEKKLSIGVISPVHYLRHQLSISSTVKRQGLFEWEYDMFVGWVLSKADGTILALAHSCQSHTPRGQLTGEQLL